jgi:pimeloyl-ACP methyl ester carboxylesterase
LGAAKINQLAHGGNILAVEPGRKAAKTLRSVALSMFAGATFGAAAGLSIASADPQTAPSDTISPLTLTNQGYFFVGGEYVESGGKRLMAGQMYVEFLTPQNVTHPYPIVMIHGTAQTGTNFMGTPDGRPGWAHNFLARGYRVYVVDQVGRGRSGADPQIYGPYMRFAAEQEQSLFSASENYNLWPQATLHTQWPGGPGVTGNAAFDQFYASQVESIASTVKTEELMFPADVALLEKIGPAIVLTHSQSGVFGFKLADARPDLVKAHIAVEPNGPPFYDIDFKGGDAWYKDSDKIARFWGVARLPLAFDPPAAEASDLHLARQEQADEPTLVRCWLQAEPARQLPQMKNVPTAIVTGEASFRATYDHCTSKFLTQAGVRNAHIRLEKSGLHGNGHMMMLEQNSAAIAGVIADWLDQNVK